MSASNGLAFQCRAIGLPAPVLEYRFHPPRRWRVDACWPALWLAVEIEGGVFTRGRHIRPSGFLRDAEKYNQLALDGYTLLRFTPAQVRDGIAVTAIEGFLKRNRAG